MFQVEVCAVVEEEHVHYVVLDVKLELNHYVQQSEVGVKCTDKSHAVECDVLNPTLITELLRNVASVFGRIIKTPASYFGHDVFLKLNRGLLCHFSTYFMHEDVKYSFLFLCRNLIL